MLRMLNLSNVMGWGSLDVDALKKYILIANEFGIDIEDVKEDMSSYEGDILDINNWFYSTISLTFYSIMEGLGEYVQDNIEDEDVVDFLLDKIEELKDNFSPFINYLDSWYNNILDNIDLTQEADNIFNDIVQEMYEDLEEAI